MTAKTHQDLLDFMEEYCLVDDGEGEEVSDMILRSHIVDFLEAYVEVKGLVK